MDEPINHDKQRVALISMLASAALAFLKFSAAVLSGSLGLLTEALHSLIDLGATIITLFAVRWADQPADDDHQFGHAKIESVAALLETMLLFGTAAYIAYEAISRLLLGHAPPNVQWWAFAIMVFSIVVDFNRSRALHKTAAATSSDALAADATHFESDMWSSFAVLIGLTGAWLGWPWADPIAALMVAVFIAKMAWGLGNRTLATLLDAAPEGLSSSIRIIAEQQDGVLAVNQLRVRPAGATLFVNLELSVSRVMALSAIGEVKATISAAILQIIPQADISISTSPIALDNETAFEKINLIAGQRNLNVHHITVQQIQGRMAVSFDLELDGSTSLKAAHATATKLEEAIRAGLGGNIEVESHIEPQPLRLLAGEPASPKLRKQIETALFNFAKAEKTLSDLHNVRVRTTAAGVFVHYHCRFAPSQNVDYVHAVVDRIENSLQSKFTEIKRVVAHAEPIGLARHKL